jgi:hypothetical protein
VTVIDIIKKLGFGDGFEAGDACALLTVDWVQSQNKNSRRSITNHDSESIQIRYVVKNPENDTFGVELQSTLSRASIYVL